MALAAAQGQKLLADARRTHLAQDLLKHGSSLLSELQRNPEASPHHVVAEGKLLQSDEQRRNRLLTTIKDSVIAFLLDYLPSVEVPPIKEDKQGAPTHYEISHLDLKVFVLACALDLRLLPAAARVSPLACFLCRASSWPARTLRFSR